MGFFLTVNINNDNKNLSKSLHNTVFFCKDSLIIIFLYLVKIKIGMLLHLGGSLKYLAWESVGVHILNL